MGLLNAIELWCSEEPYCGFRSATIGWRLLPAEASGKVRHYWDGDRCIWDYADEYVDDIDAYKEERDSAEEG